MKLYDYVLSGNCYKVRLLIGFLKLECEMVSVDFYPGRQHKSPEFLELNPLGELPVLEDGELRLCGSQAILLYLASRYGAGGPWWSADSVSLGVSSQWLGFADQLTSTSGAARLHDMLGYELDVEAARAAARKLYRILEDHLSERELNDMQWIVGVHPNIADVACFPYSALAGDAGIDLTTFPAIQRWIRRFRELPGFVGMPGVDSIRS